jgi:hypothetical protein
VKNIFRTSILIIVLLTALTGCQAVMKKMYGIKNPDIESEKNILKKAAKFELDQNNIVCVNIEDFVGTLQGQGIPDCSIYDAKGKYIEYREADTSCNAGLFGFIPALRLNAEYRQPDTLSLQQEFMKFRDLKGNPVNVEEGYDFYLLIYWTVWAGRLNKDHVKVWEDLAKENKQARIKVVKVNLDFQEHWDKHQRDALIEKLEKK